MRALYRLLDLLFPPKCVLCGRLLEREETDLCGACRREGPVFSGGGMSIPFVTAWMAVYRYEGLARDSLLRFKFGGRQSYAAAYGRLLAARIQGELRAEFDLLTYVPVSPRRRWSRGYDQVRLLAEAVGRELGQKPVRALKKIRHNPAQSSLREREQRRANVLGRTGPFVPKPWPVSGFCCWTTSSPPAPPFRSAPGCCRPPALLRCCARRWRPVGTGQSNLTICR